MAYLCIVVDDKVFVGWNRKLIEQGNYFYAFSHVPIHQITIPLHTFTITSIRDPIGRLLSHYYMLMDYKEARVIRSDLKEEMKWLGNSFSDFVTNIPQEHLLRQLYMFSARYDVAEAFDNIVNCSHVLFTDTLAEDANNLSQKLNLNLTPVHIRRTSKKQEIDPAGLDLAQIALEPELRLCEQLEKHKLGLDNSQL